MPQRDFSRQNTLIDQDVLSTLNVQVIGLGAVGRPLATMLAAIGVKRISLVDFDIVDRSNITTQLYASYDYDYPKVDRVADVIRHIDDYCSVEKFESRWTPEFKSGYDCFFCCVDSIKDRKEIYEGVSKDPFSFWCDPRMLSEFLSVFTVTDETDPKDVEYYESCFWDKEEIEAGSCTAKSTCYTGATAAGLMMHQFRRYINTMPTDVHLDFNMLASELSVYDAKNPPSFIEEKEIPATPKEVEEQNETQEENPTN